MKDFSHNQKRSIQSTVHVIEEKLRDMEVLLTWVSDHPGDYVQIVIACDLSKEEILFFRSLVDKMHQVLFRITNTYQLEKQSVSLRQIIQTKAVMIWEDMTGTSFERLKGYEELDSDLRQEYEKMFSELEQLANEIINNK